MSQSIYDFKVRTIDGKETTLEPYKGKVMLIVNVASQCGFTPQYDGLEKLHEELGPKGFSVLGFPCNQFGKQEPGGEADIKTFCETKFGIKFPMFSKVDVNGEEAHPLYNYLKAKAKGLLGTQAVKWNFTKFLVDRDGKVLKRFPPTATPEKIRADVEKALS
jgi:glutathione peroxidase